jgi:ABC-2 type transport system ATP-binding protein
MNDAAIICEDLVKNFKSTLALDGVSFSVDKGSVLGLLGPNGAGKTTAVRILTTIIKPDKGSARVLGFDVIKNAAKVRRVIGLAGQYAAVDENLTGYENLLMVGMLNHIGFKASREKAGQLLHIFDLDHAAKRPVKTYSGGMRRRLDLAAALVCEPEVLFLDEPTTGLDPKSRIDLWEVIENLVEKGSSLLLTTQYLEEADRLANRIAVINYGKLIAEGTSQELKQSIGDRVLELEFENQNQCDEAFDLLKNISLKLPNKIGMSVEVSIGQGAREISEALKILEEKNINSFRLSVREPSLDDVFLELTGSLTGQ